MVPLLAAACLALANQAIAQSCQADHINIFCCSSNPSIERANIFYD